MSGRWMLWSVLAAALVWTLSIADSEAASRRRRRSGPTPAQVQAAKQRLATRIQQQVDSARRALGSAEIQAREARSTIETANSRLEGARSSLESARTGKRTASEELDEIEEDLITIAGADSPISLARDRMEDAEDDLQDAEHRTLNAPSYLAHVVELDGLADRAVKLAEFRKQALTNDAKYQAALPELTAAREAFSKLRSEVIYQDPKWIAASESLREQQQEENAANTEATKAGLQKLPAGRDLREATAVAAAARAKIARGEAAIKSLSGGKSKGAKPTSSSSKKKKK